MASGDGGASPGGARRKVPLLGSKPRYCDESRKGYQQEGQFFQSRPVMASGHGGAQPNVINPQYHDEEPRRGLPQEGQFSQRYNQGFQDKTNRGYHIPARRDHDVKWKQDHRGHSSRNSIEHSVDARSPGYSKPHSGRMERDRDHEVTYDPRNKEQTRGRGRGLRENQGPVNSPDRRHSQRHIRNQQRCIDTYTLTTLSTSDPSEIVMQLGAEGSGCDELLNKKTMTEEVQKLLLKTLARACQCTSSRMLMSRLLVLIWKSTYLTTHIQQQIVRLLTGRYHEEDLLKTVTDMMTIMHALLQQIPSSCSEVSVLITLLDSTLKPRLEHQEQSNSENYKGLLRRLQEMKDLYETLVVDENDRVRQAVLKSHYKAAPNDFRQIPLLPKSSELNKDEEPFLRQNLTSGKYVDKDHYLDVQYRLLREDFVAPLRQGISEYLDRRRNPELYKDQRIQDLRLYTRVRILDPSVGRNGIIHTIRFDTEPLSRINWENTKRLLPGSLVCLTKDHFSTVLFAIVENRSVEELKDGRLKVKFDKLQDIIQQKPTGEFVMAETTAYFEQYRPVLLGLQELGKLDLYGKSLSMPMEQYIVDVSRKIDCPAYLKVDDNTIDGKPHYDLHHLTSEHVSSEKEYDNLDSKRVQMMFRVKNDRTRRVEILESGLWPESETLQLDDSQLAAFQTALTREFALIQGPPGTGKTYVGLKVAETLLKNKGAWSKSEGRHIQAEVNRPILVVCYTNHALDQFLEGIYKFDNNIIRVGGRSSSEILKQRNLTEIRSKKRTTGNRHRRRVYQDHDRLKRLLENAEDRLDFAYRSIIDEFVLQPYMSEQQFQSLKSSDRFDHQKYENRTVILRWLGLTGDQWTHRKRKRAVHQIQNQIEDGNIDVLGEAELITQLRLMEEEDPVIMEHRQERRTALQEEFAFVVDSPPKNDKLTVEDVREIEGAIQFELGRKRYDKCSDQQADGIEDVWATHPRHRWRLYRYWLSKYVQAQKQMILKSQEIYEKLSEQQKEFDVEEDEEILKHASVVGMTTTGAAKNRVLLQRVKPRIVIVEEAAEVLEAHIITSLTTDCQHLILIGDHQQLRPNPTVYRLAKQFKLDVSLFERMIKNRLPCQQLHDQHRMRPEISILMKRHFYKDLKDHPSVEHYEHVKGVTRNIYFIQHNEVEEEEGDTKSRSNEHEAAYIVGLCRYFLKQGYSHSQITILTTYTGQMFNLRNRMDKDTFDGVKVSVVDNYQGEENDIILLSLVRSNVEGSVGFLRVDNRVCVALSRAKIGLYCIGNLQLLADKSETWKDILATLSETEATGTSLQLICHNHSHITQASCADDFKQAPDGGCSQRCDFRLPCGHVCEKSCHPVDPGHKETVCYKPCTRICLRGHPCDLKCMEPCKCIVKVDITMEACGHVQTIPCHQVEDWKCKEPCERELVCDHLCTRTCGEDCLPQDMCENPCNKTCVRGHPCTLKCREVCVCRIVVTKTMSSCGHEQQVPCAEYEQWNCKESCEKKLECDHICTRTCGEDCLPRDMCEHPCNNICVRDHQCTLECRKRCVCRIVVTKTMPSCGHEQTVPCANFDQWTCKKPCEKTLECGHLCQEECGEDCADSTCGEPCKKKLLCGHVCPKRCSKVCESKLRLSLQKRFCARHVEISLPKCKHKVSVVCKNNPELNEIYKAIVPNTMYSRYFRKEPTYPKCPEQCPKLLTCGHQCSNQCETCEHNKPEHGLGLCDGGQYQPVKPCMEQCNKKLNCGHPCQKLCKDPCRCEILVDKKLHTCGHEKRIKCCDDPASATCDQTCSKKLACDHPCRKLCRDPCQEDCKQMVTKTLPKCGHEVIIECRSKLTSARCKQQCVQKLPCGHSCKNKCFEKCTSKCNVKVEKVLDCDHKKQSECWVEKETIKCQKKCAKKLKCGHVCRGVCSKPCDADCAVKKKVTIPECGHTVLIKCHQSAADATCTCPCKKKLRCGHKCRNACGKPCETQCQARRGEIMKDCQHCQQVLCQVDVKDHICQVPCGKPLQCKHRCVKRCGEQCSCGKTRNVKMPRCGHMQTIGCESKASEYICQENCRRKLRCGHRCTNKCGEPCVTQCSQTREVILRKCKHKQMVPCHMQPKDFKCIAKCKRKLSCSHPCQQVCGEPCTEKCQERVKRKPLKCSHRKDVKCSDDVKTVVCEIKCPKKLPCGHKCTASCGEPCRCNDKCPRRLPCRHWCKERCGEPCTKTCNVKMKKTIEECGHRLPNEVPCPMKPQRADCRSICGKKLACGHTCNRQCNKCTGHANGDQTEPCRQTCGTVLQCGHRCRATCHECFEGRLHVPCKRQCQLTLLCGCVCQRQCNLCMRSCSCKRDHKTRSKNKVSDADTTNPDGRKSTDDRKSVTFSKIPCEKKLKCGHGCIGLSGEPCIKLCRLCNRRKLQLFFPESKLSKDSCYIQLTPCGHVAEISSLANEFGTSKGCYPVKPVCCPKCKQIPDNERFKDILSDWTKDVDKIKILMDGDKQTDSSVVNLQVPAAVYSDNLSQCFANSGVWMAAIKKEESSLKGLLNDTAVSEDRTEIMTTTRQKVKKIFEAINRVVSPQATKKISSSHLDSQMIHDISHELCRICCWFDIWQVLGSISSFESCSKQTTTLINRIVENVSIGGTFTERKYKEVQRRTKELQVEVFGKGKERSPHSISLPIQKRCSVGFNMGDWFKCREGHYFSRSQCQSGRDTKKDNLRCPFCVRSTAVMSPSTSVTGGDGRVAAASGGV